MWKHVKPCNGRPWSRWTTCWKRGLMKRKEDDTQYSSYHHVVCNQFCSFLRGIYFFFWIQLNCFVYPPLSLFFWLREETTKKRHTFQDKHLLSTHRQVLLYTAVSEWFCDYKATKATITCLATFKKQVITPSYVLWPPVYFFCFSGGEGDSAEFEWEEREKVTCPSLTQILGNRMAVRRRKTIRKRTFLQVSLYEEHTSFTSFSSSPLLLLWADRWEWERWEKMGTDSRTDGIIKVVTLLSTPQISCNFLV